MKELLNKHVFHIFDVNLRSKLVLMHEHVMNNQEHIKTFKHIQENLNNYYHALILNSHHGNTKKQVKEMNYTFMQYPYGGGGDSW